MTTAERLRRLGIVIPEIMVPGAGMQPEYWSVIACDQFTSEHAYWTESRRIVGEEPSTLDMIIPECYLEDGDLEQRTEKAHRSMEEILARGILRTLPPGFVLVERSTPFTSRRRGLVLALDLEAYDYTGRQTSLVRPSEGTIRNRLPSRMAVRRGASLDLPHILLLIDDPGDIVMETASAAAKELVYDFDLMQGGGHLTGHLVENIAPLARAFESLVSETNLLFAVGDGNHSLAAAKEVWREKQAEGAGGDHPARFALLEVVNIHDAGLHFHPIHRVLFGVDENDFISFMERELSGGSGTEIITIAAKNRERRLTVNTPQDRLAVEVIQELLEAYLAGCPNAAIDYIHGAGTVRELTGTEGRAGVLLPELGKKDFFRRITGVGPYPRKSFSIGEAVEKRYYLESRRLD